MSRDRDVRNAAQAALMATNAFDNVYLWSLDEQSDRSAEDARGAAIEPTGWKETDAWDAVSNGEIWIDGSCKLIVFARDEEIQTRDEWAENLVEYACNALNGQSLAGLTLPQWTKIVGVTWKPARPPERRIEATFQYRYFVNTLASFDTTA